MGRRHWRHRRHVGAPFPDLFCQRYEDASAATAHVGRLDGAPCSDSHANRRDLHTCSCVVLNWNLVFSYLLLPLANAACSPVLQEPSLDAEALVADPPAARTAVQRRVRRIAEQAFWDSLAQVGDSQTAAAVT